MNGFPMSALQHVGEPLSAESRPSERGELGGVLKHQFGLTLSPADLAELEEMVPRDSELDTIDWIRSAAAAVSARVSEIPSLTVLEGELLKRWVGMRWNWVPTDEQLHKLIGLVSEGEKHGAHLPRVTLELFRLLRQKADFHPNSIEQLVRLITHLQFDTRPILIFEPASASDEAEVEPELKPSARVRQILGLGKRKEKLRKARR